MENDSLERDSRDIAQAIVRLMGAKVAKGGIDEEKRTIKFVVSSHARDSYGSIIWQDGIDIESRYRANPIFAWHHVPLLDSQNAAAGCVPSPGPENAVGKAIEIIREGERTIMVFQFLPKGVNPRADLCFEQYLDGTLNACSIGMVGITEVFADADEEALMTVPEGLRIRLLRGEAQSVITKGTLVEVSAVFIGANPDALVMRGLVDRRMESRERAFCVRASKMMAAFDEKMASLDAQIARQDELLRCFQAVMMRLELRLDGDNLAKATKLIQATKQSHDEAQKVAKVVRAVTPYL